MELSKEKENDVSVNLDMSSKVPIEWNKARDCALEYWADLIARLRSVSITEQARIHITTEPPKLPRKCSYRLPDIFMYTEERELCIMEMLETWVTSLHQKASFLVPLDKRPCFFKPGIHTQAGYSDTDLPSGPRSKQINATVTRAMSTFLYIIHEAAVSLFSDNWVQQCYIILVGIYTIPYFIQDVLLPNNTKIACSRLLNGPNGYITFERFVQLSVEFGIEYTVFLVLANLECIDYVVMNGPIPPIQLRAAAFDVMKLSPANCPASNDESSMFDSPYGHDMQINETSTHTGTSRTTKPAHRVTSIFKRRM